jgi:hypothetical protein
MVAGIGVMVLVVNMSRRSRPTRRSSRFLAEGKWWLAGRPDSDYKDPGYRNNWTKAG